jgi:hypothetical protein
MEMLPGTCSESMPLLVQEPIRHGDREVEDRTSSRVLKKSASIVPCLRRSASRRQVASLRGSPYRTEYASPLRSLRPCLGQGASRRARVGRVRSLAFLSILLEA